MEKVSINFNDVVITMPNGEVLQAKDYSKIASTFLWKSAPTIPLYQAALKLHDGESVEVSKDELSLLLQIFLPQNQWALPFAMFPMLTYLQAKLELFKEVK
jgi:hypothetical protein